jgi:hypothetical protein
MRNAIEKLQPAYDWNKTSESVWEGISGEKYRKKICFEFKNNRINVLIYNNNRKSRNDSKTFTNVSDAENYMFEYIKQTTLK